MCASPALLMGVWFRLSHPIWILVFELYRFRYDATLLISPDTLTLLPMLLDNLLLFLVNLNCSIFWYLASSLITVSLCFYCKSFSRLLSTDFDLCSYKYSGSANAITLDVPFIPFMKCVSSKFSVWF